MADLYNYITSSGVIVPDTDSVKSDVQEEYKAALGNDLILTDSTPQGRLIDTETLARQNLLRTAALMANVINPNVSFGVFLDALCALTGCVRKSASKTRVTATLGGTPNTVVPANVLAQTIDGSDFYLENAVTLDVNGQGTGVFLSVEDGAVQCAAGSLNRVKTTVLGWETVTNANAGIVGADTESDRDLKVRRLETLYQGRSFLGDISSKLANVPNIQSWVVRQNYKSAPLVVNGVSIKPYSVYVCAYGGSDADIAMALYMSVPAGCDYTGNTDVTVTDPWVNQDYVVSFQRPTEVSIDVKVYIRVSTGTGDVTGAVKQAISDYQEGLIENIDGLQIGVAVSPFEIASAINIEVPGVFVQQVQITKHGGALSTESIPVGINEIARISADNITIRYAQ